MADEEEKVPLWKNKMVIAVAVVILVIILAYFGGFLTASVTSKKDRATSNKNQDDDESESEDDEDSEKFVVSGGRSDSNGGDWALKDKIHDINERQRKFVRNAGRAYKYDARADSAAPTVYSPEDELQRELYMA